MTVKCSNPPPPPPSPNPLLLCYDRHIHFEVNSENVRKSHTVRQKRTEVNILTSSIQFLFCNVINWEMLKNLISGYIRMFRPQSKVVVFFSNKFNKWTLNRKPVCLSLSPHYFCVSEAQRTWKKNLVLPFTIKVPAPSSNFLCLSNITPNLHKLKSNTTFLNEGPPHKTFLNTNIIKIYNLQLPFKSF